MFVPSHREWERWDKVGQESAFWRPAVTIFVTIVKDQDVKHMFTLPLRVYHTCQEVFLFFFELPRSSDRGSRPSKSARRRLAADFLSRASHAPKIYRAPCPTNIPLLTELGSFEDEAAFRSQFSILNFPFSRCGLGLGYILASPSGTKDPPASSGGLHCRGPHVSKGVRLNADSRRIATAFMP